MLFRFQNIKSNFKNAIFYIKSKSMNCVIFLDLGEGWVPAVLNNQRELDFIREGQKLFCHNDRSYWIGGSTNIQRGSTFNISQYNTGDTGNMMPMFNSTSEINLSLKIINRYNECILSTITSVYFTRTNSLYS